MATSTIEFRPFCQTDGCNKLAAATQHLPDGRIRWRKWCSCCHNARTAANHGLTNAAELTARRKGKTLTEYLREKKEKTAKNAGFNSITEYVNSIHPYRKHRKDFCENIDGRLGYKCTSTIVWEGMLDVDHIDGNPTNNSEANLQTLCKCCHAYKTNQEQDWLTPGRKELGVTY